MLFLFYFNFIPPFIYFSCFLTCPLGNINDHHVFSLLPRYLLACSCSCSYRFALGLGGPFSTLSGVFLDIWDFIFPSMTSHAISLGHASALHTYNLPIFVIDSDNQPLKITPLTLHIARNRPASYCLFHFLTYPLNGHRHTGHVSI